VRNKLMKVIAKPFELTSEEEGILKNTDDEDRIKLLISLFKNLSGTEPDHLSKAGGRVKYVNLFQMKYTL